MTDKNISVIRDAVHGRPPAEKADIFHRDKHISRRSVTRAAGGAEATSSELGDLEG